MYPYKKKLKYPKLMIIGFIADWIEKHNNPPTLQQICNGLKLKAKSGVSQHLHEMGIDYSKEKYKLMYRCPFCGKDLKEKIERDTSQDKYVQEIIKRMEEERRPI